MRMTIDQTGHQHRSPQIYNLSSLPQGLDFSTTPHCRYPAIQYGQGPLLNNNPILILSNEIIGKKKCVTRIHKITPSPAYCEGLRPSMAFVSSIVFRAYSWTSMISPSTGGVFITRLLEKVSTLRPAPFHCSPV